MILTICVFAFASLVSTEPVSETCYRVTDKELSKVVVACGDVNHDPLSTCEVQRMGATRYYVRIRTIGTGRDEAPTSSTKREEV